jgi:hypothetical protein
MAALVVWRRERPPKPLLEVDTAVVLVVVAEEQVPPEIQAIALEVVSRTRAVPPSVIRV